MQSARASILSASDFWLNSWRASETFAKALGLLSRKCLTWLPRLSQSRRSKRLCHSHGQHQTFAESAETSKQDQDPIRQTEKQKPGTATLETVLMFSSWKSQNWDFRNHQRQPMSTNPWSQGLERDGSPSSRLGARSSRGGRSRGLRLWNDPNLDEKMLRKKHLNNLDNIHLDYRLYIFSYVCMCVRVFVFIHIYVCLNLHVYHRQKDHLLCHTLYQNPERHLS